jgi:hypothetical protein
VSQAQLLSSSISLSHGTPIRLLVQTRKEWECQGWGPWAFRPPLLVTYALWVCSHVYHFHLTMDAAVHARLAQCMMDRSWSCWSLVESLPSIKVQYQVKSFYFSHNESSYTERLTAYIFDGVTESFLSEPRFSFI